VKLIFDEVMLTFDEVKSLVFPYQLQEVKANFLLFLFLDVFSLQQDGL
jgi:hypothetical protein